MSDPHASAPTPPPLPPQSVLVPSMRGAPARIQARIVSLRAGLIGAVGGMGLDIGSPQ